MMFQEPISLEFIVYTIFSILFVTLTLVGYINCDTKKKIK
jgi:hypothetical protein